MLHSTITRKGQTTIPGKVREALNLKPGDVVSYELSKNRATLRLQPSAGALKGALKSDRGRGLTFREIRDVAKTTRVKKSGKRGAAA